MTNEAALLGAANADIVTVPACSPSSVSSCCKNAGAFGSKFTMAEELHGQPHVKQAHRIDIGHRNQAIGAAMREAQRAVVALRQLGRAVERGIEQYRRQPLARPMNLKRP